MDLKRWAVQDFLLYSKFVVDEMQPIQHDIFPESIGGV